MRSAAHSYACPCLRVGWGGGSMHGGDAPALYGGMPLPCMGGTPASPKVMTVMDLLGIWPGYQLSRSR